MYARNGGKSQGIFQPDDGTETSAEDKPALNQLQTGDGVPLTTFEKLGLRIRWMVGTWSRWTSSGGSEEETLLEKQLAPGRRDGKVYLQIKVKEEVGEALGALALEEAAFPESERNLRDRGASPI
ncbi:MAG: hypothetical protein WKG07_01230 [Hymenobacter sp.]